MCVSPRKYKRVAKYTWSETAGGRPNDNLLVFDNLTKEHNGRRVSCQTTFRHPDYGYSMDAHSAIHMLKVYCEYTLTDNKMLFS